MVIYGYVNTNIRILLPLLLPGSLRLYVHQLVNLLRPIALMFRVHSECVKDVSNIIDICNLFFKQCRPVRGRFTGGVCFVVLNL